MKRSYVTGLVAVLLLMVFSGCRELTETSEIGIPSVETAPTVFFNPGYLNSELLTIASLEEDRCGRTSFGGMMESETGFYFGNLHYLYYADKSDLSDWVYVCPLGDCVHGDRSGSGLSDCEAYSMGYGYLLRDNRIYLWGSDGMSAFRNRNPGDLFLVSQALDGSDKQVAYDFTEVSARMNANQGSFYPYLAPDHLLLWCSALNPQGTYDQQIFCLDEDGLHTLYTDISQELFTSISCANSWYNLYGDTCYYLPMVEGSTTKIYRIQDYALVGTEIEGLPLLGAYLSGDTLRTFRSGDGYYDVNLTTRQETKLAEPQLEHSGAYVIEPNCILESTFWDGAENPQAPEEHLLYLFNGRQWLEVDLPQELKTKEEHLRVIPSALTTDRILFRVIDGNDYLQTGPIAFYQVLLDTEEPVLEPMGILAPG